MNFKEDRNMKNIRHEMLGLQHEIIHLENLICMFLNEGTPMKEEVSDSINVIRDELLHYLSSVRQFSESSNDYLQIELNAIMNNQDEET